MLFRERLLAPVSWWVLAALFGLSVSTAVVVAAGLAWALAVGGASLVVAGALFWAGAATIRLTDTDLTVGRSRIELRYLGECRALDAEQTQLRAGPGADARAYLVLRPYVSTAVEFSLADPDDPVPYWLVSSRRPHELAAAVEEARTRAAATSPNAA